MRWLHRRPELTAAEREALARDAVRVAAGMERVFRSMPTTTEMATALTRAGSRLGTRMQPAPSDER